MAKAFAKSVRDRLLLQTQKVHGNYQQVLIRYFHERLIYRLAQSRYKSSFYLKGGTLLFALDPIIARPTLDVDLLGINFNHVPLLHNMHLVARVRVPAVVEHEDRRIPKGFVHFNVEVELRRANAIGLRCGHVNIRLQIPTQQHSPRMTSLYSGLMTQ